MKLRHNPNGGWRRPSAVTDDDYEAQVQRTTAKAERRYARAQQRLADAEARLAKAASSRKTPNRQRVLAELEAAVEQRRRELEQIRALMVQAPASAQHRGTKSFRPTPAPREF